MFDGTGTLVTVVVHAQLTETIAGLERELGARTEWRAEDLSQGEIASITALSNALLNRLETEEPLT
jgi:hypothetical protein